MKNLLKDDAPILFEGLHSCYHIDDRGIKDRLKIYRESNIEHRYYYNLFKVDKKVVKKLYFFVESLKLRLYQNILKHSDLMLVVSREDTDYLKEHFPDIKVNYLPSFHANDKIESLIGFGDYALYNGNIEVPENAHAVQWLINEVFATTDIKLKVAGMNPPEYIRKLASEYPNVEIIANPDDKKMFDLIKNAQVNILVTFQATGLKLKLLNTLYNGRFCLVNDKMLNGTGLEELCKIGNTPEELRKKLPELFKVEFDKNQIDLRNNILNLNFSNSKNAEKLIELVY